MTPLVIRTAEDAIAAVPYLLGFHPSRSLVVIGFDNPVHGTCAIRLDLPASDAADRVAALLAGNGFRRSLLLGYGPDDEVRESVAALSPALASADVPAAEAVRVADGRWWSLTCDDACCPAEGVPYDSSATVVAAQATFAGQVALADRAELVRSVQPFDGPVRTSMRRATDRAERRARTHPDTTHEAVTFISTVLARAHTGTRPTDDEVARLGILLTDLRLRDEAWVRIDEESPTADIAFWRDIVRRVEEPYVPAPASLLTFAAYAAGDGGLANVALERALDTDPTYSLARILREVINAGIPPTKLRLRMTPDELATAYDTHPPKAC
ncbi:uncharacterized protein DUF4192 [Actinomadura pelletieri DSM 43383]|uniref:Uncharacterized protein DUF4192 n=1 Tax=Actinomadura pelletieri DSM 43383 TaxID=1120940 RepID=A0A495QAB4_9ACTN|nr:DUF4192 domain-containing protein [Actinomadura pelletieri]RKS68648.1 uncharacterized protein DUF4192 [Actinomadura pelletieri DSM 43383]